MVTRLVGPMRAIPPGLVSATGKPYHELGADYFTSRLDPERETRRLIARLEALVYRVALDDAV